MVSDATNRNIKQNPLHMQGVSQKTVGGKLKGRLNFRRPMLRRMLSY
ncbi:hypothetical protein NMH_0417 [Neisseria meningitidis H44/76]|uniref:Uncharacterized protein n=2 Tax=Neisseria meningitidis TaxID=487 RepID=E6MUG9_NEIMH|nr:hypothetical protein NMH_0417 [Neisseria meningitidis H44/76]KER39966.1 hypothetical protein F528_1086 [Neisseria meningitidis 992008]